MNLALIAGIIFITSIAAGAAQLSQEVNCELKDIYGEKFGEFRGSVLSDKSLRLERMIIQSAWYDQNDITDGSHSISGSPTPDGKFFYQFDVRHDEGQRGYHFDLKLPNFSLNASDSQGGALVHVNIYGGNYPKALVEFSLLDRFNVDCKHKSAR